MSDTREYEQVLEELTQQFLEELPFFKVRDRIAKYSPAVRRKLLKLIDVEGN